MLLNADSSSHSIPTPVRECYSTVSARPGLTTHTKTNTHLILTSTSPQRLWILSGFSVKTCWDAVPTLMIHLQLSRPAVSSCQITLTGTSYSSSHNPLLSHYPRSPPIERYVLSEGFYAEAVYSFWNGVAQLCFFLFVAWEMYGKFTVKGNYRLDERDVRTSERRWKETDGLESNDFLA